MEYRALGTTDQKLSVLSIGSYHTYERMSQEEIVAFLKRALDAGIDWFDVGHYTSAAHPEAPVSETDLRFAAARDAAGIARTDYFHTQKLWYGGPRPSFADQLTASFPRVGIDYADCVIYNPDTAYFFHTPVDMEQIVQEMADLVERGLTRFWGINHALPEEIDRACRYASERGLPLPSVLQEPYSVIQRRLVEDPEKDAVARRWGLSIQPSNVLAVGVLAGRHAADSARPLGPQGMTSQAESVSDLFSRRASEVGATPAQLALAFVLANPLVVSALFGASRIGQLEDDLGAVELLRRLGADGIREAVADIPQNEAELRIGQLDGVPAVE